MNMVEGPPPPHLEKGGPTIRKVQASWMAQSLHPIAWHYPCIQFVQVNMVSSLHPFSFYQLVSSLHPIAWHYPCILSSCDMHHICQLNILYQFIMVSSLHYNAIHMPISSLHCKKNASQKMITR